MSPSFERIRELVLDARHIPADERNAWLDDACGGDHELRAEVASLLQHDASDDDRLQTGGAVTAALPDEAEPERIGPYRILHRAGEGGFGEVYAAEQETPIRRPVALKILKRGMDTRAVLARFEAECQALARMDHPSIARILDAGETETGRPYFVMDWIEGTRITDHVRRNHLTVRERVRLMASVAGAVAHAHRRGILHRDLKPTNILVAAHDDGPRPIVIDFGIAKAIDAPLTEQTLHTAQGQLLGTPTYMSPEQASGEAMTPASDVYALGVVLYELLTGAPPIDPGTLTHPSAEEISRRIRQADAPPPSRRADEAERSDVAGELDGITLAALEPEPDRRYPTAAALAADLDRYLRGEPVEAPARTASHHVGRRLRRWQRQVHDGMMSVAVRTGVSVKLALQARTIAEERDRANREREAAERVSEFLASMLRDVQPATLGNSLWTDMRARIAEAEASSGRAPADTDALLERLDAAIPQANPTNVALRLLDEEILARAGRTIDESLDRDPAIAARLRVTLGATYQELGLYAQAEPYLRDALAERTRLLGPDHADTLHALNRLAVVLQRLDRLDEAESTARDALARARRALGDDHRETLAAWTGLGGVLGHRDALAEAEEVRRTAAGEHRRVLGEHDHQTITAIGNLGFLLTNVGKHGEAEDHMRTCLDLATRFLGGDHGTTISAGNNLAMLLVQTDRPAEAEPLMREVLASYRRVRGDDHLETLIAHSNLATILDRQEKYADAERTLSRALDGLRRVAGETHLFTLVVRQNLGSTLRKLDRLDEAESHLRATHELNVRAHGADHQHTLAAAGQLGEVLVARGALDEANRLLLDAIARAERVLPPSDWTLAILRLRQADAHEARGETVTAIAQLEKAHAQLRDSLGADHERTRGAKERLDQLRESPGLPRDCG